MSGLLILEYYFTKTHGLILSSELCGKATTLIGQMDNFTPSLTSPHSYIDHF